jgi:hypothetical protein
MTEQEEQMHSTRSYPAALKGDGKSWRGSGVPVMTLILDDFLDTPSPYDESEWDCIGPSSPYYRMPRIEPVLATGGCAVCPQRGRVDRLTK